MTPAVTFVPTHRSRFLVAGQATAVGERRVDDAGRFLHLEQPERISREALARLAE
ncbi:hypothetical protein [Streptomyces canus]|uniref:hypothetical protein n=1 Tax=Streptomyces canus TaxID=58343 RepID=UPI0027D79C06|nr:hypothetical protein [Streptomyces canus]